MIKKNISYIKAVMGNIIMPEKAMLFIGVIYNTERIAQQAVTEKLTDIYGSIAAQSPVYDYCHSAYYHSEMGQPLGKFFIGFDTLHELTDFPSIKLQTNDMEDTLFSDSGKRHANLDPGYMTLGKVVLMTTKDQQHRIYLQQGIFAEPTYYYRNKQYHHYGWTYPDYHRDDYKEYFMKLRNIYYRKLRK